MTNTDYVRPVTPYTLVIDGKNVYRYALDTNLKVKKVREGAGVIFEDWESAEKVGFGLSDSDGATMKKPRGFPAPLFKPTHIPDWAVVVDAKGQKLQ